MLENAAKAVGGQQGKEAYNMTSAAMGLFVPGAEASGAKEALTYVSGHGQVFIAKAQEFAQGLVPNRGLRAAYEGAGTSSRAGLVSGVQQLENKFNVMMAKVENKLGDLTGATKGTKEVEQLNYEEQFTKIDGKKELKPKIEYTDPNGYKYRTDNHGRISNVDADLQKGTAPRNKYAQSKVGGTDRLPFDQRGHLIASIFRGSGNLDNLVPMDANLNTGAYKTLENTWSKALDSGQKVEVNMKPIYGGDSTRPSSFIVKYTIDGESRTKFLENSPGGK